MKKLIIAAAILLTTGISSSFANTIVDKPNLGTADRNADKPNLGTADRNADKPNLGTADRF
jgi:peptidoglycan hydrolase CwlO-like protein